MAKYSQDKDEQLQRFRKAMPKGSWWTDQVKTCKTIDKAWDILDIEFADKRKLMDELLTEISGRRPIKKDSKSLAQYATTITVMWMTWRTTDVLCRKLLKHHFSCHNSCQNLIQGTIWILVERWKEKRKMKMSPILLNGYIKKQVSDPEANKSPKASSENGSIEKLTQGDQTTMQPRVGQLMTKHVPLAAHQNICLLHFPPTKAQQWIRWEIVKQNKRCRKCLRAHHTNDCRKPDGTSCDKCKKNHHRTLHNEKKDPLSSNLSPNALPFSSKEDAIIADSNSFQGNADQKGEVKPATGLCPVQKVMVGDSSGRSIEVLAMLDTGSNTSLLSKNAAKRLGLTGPQTHLTMNLAGGKKKSEVSEVIEITVTSPTEEDIKKILQVHTVRKPCSSAKTVSRRSIESYPHLKTFSHKLHLSGGTVDLLIGTDLVDAFVDVHTMSGESGEPIAKRNCFGWYVMGQFDSKTMNTSRIQSVDVGTVSIVDDVMKLLHQDQLGVKPTELCTCSDNVLQENKFVKSLSDSTTLVDGRMQVGMPWKESGPPKCSNYDIAIKRMYSAEKSFKKKNCYEIVSEEVQKLLGQDFVCKVPPEQVDHNEPEWYLPLQAVFTPEKTTKVRLVFDSSSRGHDGLSLNDHLEKGPNYINSLPNVLTGWRWDEVAYAGDVRKMFNQVMVHPDDQVYHRFLWRNSTNEAPSVYQWRRLNFGDKPAPDIASNAINTLANASQVEFPEAAREVQDHTYVDDVGGSKATLTEAKQTTNAIDAILGKGQFQIKAWHSNRKEIDQSNGERFTDLLGHRWDKQEDTFSFKKDVVVGKVEEFSKRNCLALLAQLWDPIGLVAPVTIKFRIDLQELWSSGYNWDDILPESVQQKWMENVQAMNHLLTLEFDRKLKPRNAVGPPEVHGFSDGGEQAYGAVIFLRWTLDDGSYRCSSYDQTVRRSLEEEILSKNWTPGTFSPLEDVWYMPRSTEIREDQGLQESILGRLFNCLVLDQNSTTTIQTLCIGQGGWDSRNSGSGRLSLHQIEE